jgi:hypothetical protein
VGKISKNNNNNLHKNHIYDKINMQMKKDYNILKDI